MNKRNCKHCGKEFIPKGNSQKYCCPMCGVKENAKTRPVKNCVICGAEFNPINGRQKTCGKAECRKVYGNTIGKKLYVYKYKHSKNEGITAAIPNKKKKRPTAKEWETLTPCERWQYMTLTEISAECARFHISYGQAQTLQQRGDLPADFGKRGKK